jgi:hypothetical protein
MRHATRTAVPSPADVRVKLPSRATEPFHVALISQTGVAQYTTFAVMVGEARRVAEGWVRSRQPE